MVRFVTSPIRSFREVTQREPHWVAAATPFTTVGVLNGAVAGLVTWRTMAALPDEMLLWPLVIVGFLGGMFGALGFATATVLVVVIINLLSGGQESRKVAECALLAYWVQVPWSAFIVLAMGLWFHPEPSTPETIGQTLERMSADPLQRTVSLVGTYFNVWIVVLHACVLYAVAGFSRWATWVAGCGLAATFGIVPWLLS